MLRESPDGQRGLFARKNIDEQDVLAYIPDTLLMKSQFTPEEESPFMNNLDQLTTFAVFMME